MEYSKKEIEKIIINSCTVLFNEQPMFFQKKNNINELTVSAKMTKVIGKYFTEHHVNCEYNRMFDKYGKHIEKKLEINDDKLSSIFLI